MRKRAELLAHIKNTNSQYNLPPIIKNLSRPFNRTGIAERFDDDSVRKSIEVNIDLIDYYDKLLKDLERNILRCAKKHDAKAFFLLQSVHGIGEILALVILYEIHDINRFPRVQEFASYCRLVKPLRESAGKIYGSSGKKIGNAHLKWAFSEAACLFLRGNTEGKIFYAKLERKHGKGKALTVMAHKIARAVYYMLKRKTAFDKDLFLSS